MLSDLIQSFSVYAPLGTATGEKKPNDALRVIISYVTHLLVRHQSGDLQLGQFCV